MTGRFFLSKFQWLICLIIPFITFYSIIVVKLESKGGVKCGDVFWWENLYDATTKRNG